MQIVERSRRLLYLYTANVTESRRTIFSLTLVYKELLETSLSLHFSTNIFVLSLFFYLVSYIVFHCCFVDLIHFFSNIELS